MSAVSDDNLGCRCTIPTSDRFEVALRFAGALGCVGLFLLGLVLFQLPFEYSNSFSAGTGASCAAQGIGIMVISAAAFVDNIYGTVCIQRNFGFLTHFCGRGLFFMLMGLYAAPTISVLKQLGEQDNTSGTQATLALVGVIFSLLLGTAHLVLLCYRLLDGSEKKELNASGSVVPPSSLGGGGASA